MGRGKADMLKIDEVIEDNDYLMHPIKTIKPENATYKGGGAKLWEITKLIKKIPSREKVFADTVFEPLLRTSEMKSEDLVCHIMFMHELRPTLRSVQEKRLFFQFGSHIISYGREEFCLITGLKFGKEIDPNKMFKNNIASTFRPRVFPNIQDGDVTVRDLKNALLHRSTFERLTDEDAVRVALLYSLSYGFFGKEPDDKVCREWLLLADDLVAWNRYLH